MFDLGWSEMLLIGVVALIVVGPKELPGLFRQVGIFVGKARGVAREFTRAMEAAADESGIKEIDRTIRAAANPVKFGSTSLRDAALGKSPASKIPPAGAPLNPGPPLQAGKASTATEALASERAAVSERLREDAAQRATERVQPAAASAASAAEPAEAASPTNSMDEKTA